MNEILADVRQAFVRLESALSLADPVRCRPFVGDRLYAEIVATIADLAARGRRRVHGSFEILDATLLDSEPVDPARVGIRAISSIQEIDRVGNVMLGGPDLISWRQEVTATRRDAGSADPRWIIAELGEMSVEGIVNGPAGQPMDPERVRALEVQRLEHERELDERFARLRHVSVLTYLTLQGA